ncbi:MAG: hypothetical protein IKW60_00010 [Clostridia bacterium]|nr:hypothetical protein [Clostridia bacterium]
MTQKEHQDAIHRMAEISELLTRRLDEIGQDLFEEYCTILEKVTLYENKKS